MSAVTGLPCLFYAMGTTSRGINLSADLERKWLVSSERLAERGCGQSPVRGVCAKPPAWHLKKQKEGSCGKREMLSRRKDHFRWRRARCLPGPRLPVGLAGRQAPRARCGVSWRANGQRRRETGQREGTRSP